MKQPRYIAAVWLVDESEDDPHIGLVDRLRAQADFDSLVYVGEPHTLDDMPALRDVVELDHDNSQASANSITTDNAHETAAR